MPRHTPRRDRTCAVAPVAASRSFTLHLISSGTDSNTLFFRRKTSQILERVLHLVFLSCYGDNVGRPLSRQRLVQRLIGVELQISGHWMNFDSKTLFELNIFVQNLYNALLDLAHQINRILRRCLRRSIRT